MDDGKIDKIIDKYQGKASSLIQVLLDIQRENHWLSKEVLEKMRKKAVGYVGICRVRG